MILENKYQQLTIHPERKSWDLVNYIDHAPSIRGSELAINYHLDSNIYTVPNEWDSLSLNRVDTQDTSHGRCQMMDIEFPPDTNGISVRLKFALAEAHPLILWKFAIENIGVKPVQLGRIYLLQVNGKGISTHKASEKHRSMLTNLDGEPTFFSNGWGSWDYSGIYQPKDHFRRTRLGPITTPMRVNAGTPQPKNRGHFSSDMFAVVGDRVKRGGLLAGFLSQKQHFGSLETMLDRQGSALRMWANGDGAQLRPGTSIETDWACLQPLDLDSPTPLDPYLDAVAREHGIDDKSVVNLKSSDYTGWCSWYHFYTDIQEEDVRRNIKKILDLRQDMPLNIVQIDDGYEKRVGDWLDIKPTFTNGMAQLAEEIRDEGLIPGIWLAPFIVDPRSQLARNHPDWLIRGRFNRPANAGYSFWGRFTSGLDLTHPDALEYTQDVAYTAAHRWGFPYLKLDFLYAAAIPGTRHDQTKSRAQVLRMGLKALRKAVGEQVTLLGCGCPLGSAIGIVDAMRIGPDVDGHWLPNLYGLQALLKNEPGLPSARNAIHNTLTRAFMHRRWWINDPDCLLLSPDTDLNIHEVRSLATTIALSGGSLLLSDDLPELPQERLEIARSLLPLMQEQPQVMDWFDSAMPSRIRMDLENPCGIWHLFAHFNWLDEPQDVNISMPDYGLDPKSTYLGREYWTGRLEQSVDGMFTMCSIPAHGVVIWAVRKNTPGAFQYLGSDMHISQGLEVSKFESDSGSARIWLQRPGNVDGNVVLSLPGVPIEARLNDLPCKWQVEDLPNCFKFMLKFRNQGLLNVRY